MWIEIASALGFGMIAILLLGLVDWALGQVFDSIVCIDEKETHRGEEN